MKFSRSARISIDSSTD